VFPAAKLIGFLINPASTFTKWEMDGAQSAAHALGVELLIVEASSTRDFDSAVKSLAKTDAALISGDGLFIARDEMASLTNRERIPAMFVSRRSVRAGGLMSYGYNSLEQWPLIGEYAGRILNGVQPSDLPVHQTTKLYLAINLNTAKALGLTFPLTLLGRADDVIE
jgi:putative ABC transport system substrate-binding protein